MRSPIYSTPLSAIGTALWGAQNAMVLPLDYIQMAFGVFAGVVLSEDNSAITYSAFLTPDDMGPDSFSPITISQTTTTITVTDPNLQARGGVVVGDIVQLINTGTTVSTDGWYVVASTPSTTTYTVTSVTSQSSTDKGFAKHQYFRLFAAPAALTAGTTRTSTCLSHSTTGPVTGIVFKITARTAGSATLCIVQGEGP